MNKKEEEKRVIFLVNKLTGGGAERVVSNLSLNLPDRVKTTIALEENLVSYDYKGELISIRAPPPLRWMWKFYYVYRLIKLRKEKGVDVTISFIDAANFVNLLSDMISNQDDKIVISVRNYPSKRKSMITKGLMESFYHRADVIVVVSKLARWDLVDNFDQDEKKIKVIYNPCDVPRIREKAGEKLSAEHRALFSGGPVIINAAKFKDSGQKGQCHLIRAFKEVVKVFPDAKLMFLGEGELEKYFKKLTKKSNLEQHVHFLGFQDNPFKFLANADLFAFSSLFEGLPNILLESMAVGLPIISSDCPSGPREILAPDTDFKKQLKDTVEYAEYGVLTPVCDKKHYSAKDPLTKEEQLLAEAIIRLLQDHELRELYQKRSRKRLKEFKPEKI